MKQTLLSIIILLSATMCSAQRVIKTQTLKNTDLGNQRLEVAINKQDTVYYITLASGNRFQRRIMVGLGSKEAALKTLQFLYDLKAEDGDVIELENPTNNIAVWSKIGGGYTVYSEGKALNGHLRKPNIRGFIKAIHEFSESVKDDEKDEDDDGEGRGFNF